MRRLREMNANLIEIKLFWEINKDIVYICGGASCDRFFGVQILDNKLNGLWSSCKPSSSCNPLSDRLVIRLQLLASYTLFTTKKGGIFLQY